MKKIMLVSMMFMSSLMACPKCESIKIEKVKIFLEYKVNRCLDGMLKKHSKGEKVEREAIELESYWSVLEFVYYIDQDIDELDW